MATVSQLPGVLDFQLVKGDECTVALNLGINITGYTFTSVIYSTVVTGVGAGAGGSITRVGATVTQPTIGIVAPTAGSMLVGISEVQTNLLDPGTTYRWYLRSVAPGDVTRTLLAGSFTTVAP
jgi:hypothetical protein